MLREWVLPIKSTSPIRDRAHNTSADTQARRDPAMRQRSLVNQGVNFIDKSDRQHVDGTPERIADLGFRMMHNQLEISLETKSRRIPAADRSRRRI